MKRFTFTFSDTIWHKILEPMLHHSKLFRTIVIYYSYLRRKLIVKPVPQSILINKENHKDYNIDPDWFTRKKEMGYPELLDSRIPQISWQS